MALWYRRLKGLGFPSSLRPKITTPKPPVSTWNYPIASPLRSSHFRYYHVDRPQVRVTKYKRPAILFITLGIVGIVYFRNVERIPYTNRKRFLPLSADDDRFLGQLLLQKKKAEFEGKIVPEMDPESVRVKMILKNLVIALHKNLKKEAAAAAASQSNGVELGGFRVKTSLNFDSKPVKLASSHLEGLNWEVMVVKDDAVFACCLPGGMIIVLTGLLDQFTTNEEIATVIAIEVAHVVARHYAEWFTTSLIPVMIILNKYLGLERIEKSWFFQKEIRRVARMVIEADYIGLLLMASAGYDPRVAPKVFEKMRQAWSDSSYKNYASTHPWGKTTSKLVYNAKVMQKAISIYEEAIAS